MGDGRALATTEDAVVLLDRNGQTRLIHRSGTHARFELATDARAFGVYEQDAFAMYDGDGTLLGRMPAAPFGARHKVIDADRVLVPLVERAGQDHGRVIGVAVQTPDGRTLTRFDAPGLRFTRPSAGHVTLVTDDAVERHALDGEARWRLPLRLNDLQVAEDADRALGVAAEDSRRVVHLAAGRGVGLAEFRSAVWNLAIAPSGRFAAATTKNRLHVFVDAVLTRSITLPVAYAVSLAVSDAGALLVGGQDARHRGRVLLYDLDGKLIESRTLAVDDHAFRPRVGFDHSGGEYFVVSVAGLTRTPTPRFGAN